MLTANIVPQENLSCYFQFNYEVFMNLERNKYWSCCKADLY